MEEKQTNKQSKFDLITGKIALYSVGIISGLATGLVLMPQGINNLIEKSRIEYINQDTLPDLILGNGEIYLQKKEGGFESYNSIIQSEKTALKDSIENRIMNLSNEKKHLDLKYDIKLDSILSLFDK